MREFTHTDKVEIDSIPDTKYCTPLTWEVADRNPTDKYRAVKEYIKEHYAEEGEFDSYEAALKDWQDNELPGLHIDFKTYYAKPTHYISVDDCENDFGDCVETFTTEILLHGTDEEINEYIAVIETYGETSAKQVM